jgi:hypothetical protein
MSLLTIALALNGGVWHANLLWEVLDLGSLLRCPGKDKLLLRHGLGVVGCIEFLVQDFDSQGEFSGLGIKLTEVSNLLSHPPVIKVLDFLLEVDEVTTWSKQEGPKPGREWFNRVFLAMPNHGSLRIEINEIRGLIQALAFMKARNSAIFQPFDCYCHCLLLAVQGYSIW